MAAALTFDHPRNGVRDLHGWTTADASDSVIVDLADGKTCGIHVEADADANVDIQAVVTGHSTEAYRTILSAAYAISGGGGFHHAIADRTYRSVKVVVTGNTGNVSIFAAAVR